MPGYLSSVFLLEQRFEVLASLDLGHDLIDQGQGFGLGAGDIGDRPALP